MFGGRKDGASADGGAASNEVLVLNTDGMKWGAAPTRGSANAPVRYGHAMCCIREKVPLRLLPPPLLLRCCCHCCCGCCVAALPCRCPGRLGPLAAEPQPRACRGLGP